MKIAVIAPKVPQNVKDLIQDRIVYACDSAVEALIKQNIAIDLAIGDFDSIQDKSLLKDLKTIKLAKDKDDSDTHYAIRHAYQQCDDVILIGGLSGPRVDHLFANLLLLEQYNDLIIYNNNNLIRRLEIGTYTINKDDYTYLSLFPLMDSIVSLRGTKYSLDQDSLYAYDTIGLSNEIKAKEATLEVLKGVILIIQSKE